MLKFVWLIKQYNSYKDFIICRGYQKRAAELHNNWRDHFEEQTKKFDEKRTKLIEEIEEDETCQTRFQQTTIKVFARFYNIYYLTE